MEGFFTKKQTKSKSRPGGKVLSCASCGLYKGCTSAKMEPFGNFKKGILNIGEAPGEIEDSRGKQWQGKTGRLLKRAYDKLGIDLFEDCLNINAVNCRPPDNRTPTPYEIDCCRAVIVRKVIEEYQPKVIVLFGNAALQSFLGDRWEGDMGGITKWRGWKIPDQDFKCWVVPVFHPSYVLRESEPHVDITWKGDLETAISAASEPWPRTPAPSIEYLEDLSLLAKYQPSIGEMAFDYETTGLKPHMEGHQIVCGAITITPERTFAFMMPKTRKGMRPFTDLLQDERIMKMAHNMKYEDTWSIEKLRTEVRNWGWDSMLAAHVLDNRKYITGLKFQTYINFGIVDYASEVTPYLKGKGKSGNAINSVIAFIAKPGGQKKLLEYCALDSYYQFLLAKKQMDIMQYDFLPF